MGEGGFPERERSQPWFEEQRESRVRVGGVGRVEGEMSGDDERGIVGRAEEARAGFESESKGRGSSGGGGGGDGGAGVGELERGERGEIGGERKGEIGGVGGGGGEVGKEWEVEDCYGYFGTEEERRLVVVILVVVFKFE